MKNYHINPNNGKVSVCRAKTPDKCKFFSTSEINTPHFEDKDIARKFSEEQLSKKFDGKINNDYVGLVTMGESKAREIVEILDRTGGVDNGGDYFVLNLTQMKYYQGQTMEWSERGNNMRYSFSANRFGHIVNVNVYPIVDNYAKESDYDNCAIVEREINEVLNL